MSSDRAVQKTDDDAAGSRAAASAKGYFKDQYLHYFVRQPVSRLPLMNIGTYCRVTGLNRLINAFIESLEPSEIFQVVSLGAGSDTRPFEALQLYKQLHYIELDFATKTRKKAFTCRKNQQLMEICGQETEESTNGLVTERYRLLGCDLRQLSDLSELKLLDVPTLLISECCLCYLKLSESEKILNLFRQDCKDLSVLIYEPLGLEDSFGQVMLENLAQRGLSLPTTQAYGTIALQTRRLEALGLKAVFGDNMWSIYKTWISQQERDRISRLEFLDEVEELKLLLDHYCIILGTNRSLSAPTPVQ